MKTKSNTTTAQDLGLGTLPKEKQEEFLMRVGKIIFERVLVRVLDELDEKDKKEFDALMGKSPSDEKAILAFLEEKVDNFDEIVKEEAERFKSEAGDIINKATESPKEE